MNKNSTFLNSFDSQKTNSRNDLPFRKKTELILLNNEWNVLVDDHWSYLMFPWWWIDEDEKNYAQSAERELYEETSLKLESQLYFLWSVSWKWFPEWANNDKRKKRYEEFQWEEVFFYVWKTKKLVEISLNHEDTWENISWLPIEKCIKKLVKLADEDHPNTYPYRIAQLQWIRTLAILYNLEIPQESLFIKNRM